MVFKYIKKGFLRKLEIHVWHKKIFLDELVLMLFGAAVNFFSRKLLGGWVGMCVGWGRWVGLGGEGEERGWAGGVGVRKYGVGFL